MTPPQFQNTKRRAAPATQSPLTQRVSDIDAQYFADVQSARALRSASLSPLQAAWGDWLAPFQWDWFVTLTFAVDVHPEQARKRALRWLDALEHHPDHPAGIALIWARADERQRRQVIHSHALVAMVGAISVFAANKLWERIGGGWARIRPYQPGLGGAHYMSKGGDIELSPVWFDL